MAHLTLNGVELEITVRSGDRQHNEGVDRRMVDGSFASSRVVLKKQFGIETLSMALATADAWEGLLLGRGHVWDMTDQYSDRKGLGYTSVNGTPTFDGASGKFSKRLTLDATEYVRWTPSGDDSLAAGAGNPVGDYTIMVWKLTGTGPDVWTNYIVRSLAGNTNKWTDGVSDDAATTDWMTVTAGVLQLGNGTDAADFSDLVAVPFGIPSAWAAIWGVRTTAFPALPRLEASGTLLSSPTTPLSVRARGVSASPMPYAGAETAKVLSCSLMEV